MHCVFSGQWKDLLSMWLTWIVSTGSIDLYCLGTVVRLGDAINSCSTVGAVSQKCALHRQPVILLCGGCVWLTNGDTSELVFVLFWISAVKAVRSFWPLLSGPNTYSAIMLGSCRKETVQVQLSFALAAYCASTWGLVGGGSSAKAGCLQGDRQEGYPLCTLEPASGMFLCTTCDFWGRSHLCLKSCENYFGPER